MTAAAAGAGAAAGLRWGRPFRDRSGRPWRARPDAPWWDRPGYALLLVLLMAVPLLGPDVPPLVDLPGHMGRYRVQLDLAGSPYLQQFYDFEWGLIGNLGVDLLVMPLAPLLRLEPAVKLVTIAVPMLAAAGLLAVSREVHGRLMPTTALALPFAFGYPFTFGFINFTLAMSLALLAFALWLRLANRGRFRLRAALFVPIAAAVWVCHTLGWGLLGLLAYGAEVIRRFDAGERRGFLPFKAAVDCLPLAPPALLMLLWRSGDHASGATADWFNWGVKWEWVVRTLADRWEWWDKISLLLIAGLIVLLPLLPRVTLARKLLFPALILAAAFALLPRIVFGSAYADMRLLPYIFMTALLAIRFRPDASRRLMTAAAALSFAIFAGRVGGHALSYAAFDRTFDRELAALDRLPQGARLFSLVGTRCGRPWGERRLAHLPALALVRREAFSNDQWVMGGAQLLRVTYPVGRYSSDPSQLLVPRRCPRELWMTPEQALGGLPRDRFDHLWLIDAPPIRPELLRGLRPLWRNGNSALYRIEQP